jgi:hypothetical protein
MGSLYDFSIATAVWLAVIAQLLAIAPLVIAAHHLRTPLKPTHH